MLHSKFSRYSLLLVSVFVCALFFTGCNPNPPSEEATLVGTWESQYGDGYVISETTITYDDGGYGFGWTGTIEEIADSYIYYSKDGAFFVVAYKNLTDSSCSFSNAYKDGGKSSEASLEDAKKEFTVENGYFSYYSECAKTE